MYRFEALMYFTGVDSDHLLWCVLCVLMLCVFALVMLVVCVRVVYVCIMLWFGACTPAPIFTYTDTAHSCRA